MNPELLGFVIVSAIFSISVTIRVVKLVTFIRSLRNK